MQLIDDANDYTSLSLENDTFFAILANHLQISEDEILNQLKK